LQFISENDFEDRKCQLYNMQNPKSTPKPKNREDVINEQMGAAFLLCSGVALGKWKKANLTKVCFLL
jgi:hypothetical protein